MSEAKAQPNRRGAVPRKLIDSRIAEVRVLLTRSKPDGEIKAAMSAKWSAETPAYSIKPRSVERYIANARKLLAEELASVGGENYWASTVSWWAARMNNEELSDEKREKARKQLDTIMLALAVKKVALTDTKGKDLTIEERRTRLLGILDTLRERAGTGESRDAAGGGDAGPAVPPQAD